MAPSLNTYGHLWLSLRVQLDEKIDRVLLEARQAVVSEWPGSTERDVRLAADLGEP